VLFPSAESPLLISPSHCFTVAERAFVGLGGGLAGSCGIPPPKPKREMNLNLCKIPLRDDMMISNGRNEKGHNNDDPSPRKWRNGCACALRSHSAIDSELFRLAIPSIKNIDRARVGVVQSDVKKISTMKKTRSIYITNELLRLSKNRHTN